MQGQGLWNYSNGIGWNLAQRWRDDGASWAIKRRNGKAYGATWRIEKPSCNIRSWKRRRGEISFVERWKPKELNTSSWWKPWVHEDWRKPFVWNGKDESWFSFVVWRGKADTTRKSVWEVRLDRNIARTVEQGKRKAQNVWETSSRFKWRADYSKWKN